MLNYCTQFLEYSILRLILTPKIGVKTAFNLLQNLTNANINDLFSKPKNILPNIRKDQEQQLLIYPKDIDKYYIKHQLWLEQDNHHFINIFSPYYPKSLLDLYDPPIALYVQGDIKNLNNLSISIVGSRQATPNGLQTAYDFAKDLANHSINIISGLAEGIDTAAHKGALMHGTTTAVVGTGLDIVYPRKNLDLAYKIIKQGCIISEFLLATPPSTNNFPRRNRIIAALCKGILVVEASLQSGSLITARLANEIGRDIFAIPSSINSPNSKGCHLLIKQGANLIDNIDDILQFWWINTSLTTVNKFNNQINNNSINIQNDDDLTTKNTNLTQIQNKIIQNMGYDPIHLDILASRSQIDINVLQAEIFLLEMDNMISHISGGIYQIKK